MKICKEYVLQKNISNIYVLFQCIYCLHIYALKIRIIAYILYIHAYWFMNNTNTRYKKFSININRTYITYFNVMKKVLNDEFETDS